LGRLAKPTKVKVKDETGYFC